MVAAVSTLRRARQQLRTLDQGYVAAENKKQLQMMMEAKFEEVQTIHDLLPPPLRRKSWILSMQGYTAWGAIGRVS